MSRNAFFPVLRFLRMRRRRMSHNAFFPVLHFLRMRSPWAVFFPAGFLQFFFF